MGGPGPGRLAVVRRAPVSTWLGVLLPLLGCGDDSPAMVGDDTSTTGDPTSTGPSTTRVDATDADETAAGSSSGSGGATGGTATSDETTEGAGTCGDGRVDEGEACDDAGESERCNADCTVSECGDGIANVTAGEACDDAGESERCNADCTGSECGDGIANATAGEICDDGGDSPACDADCSAVGCGDGTVNAAALEQCDDGNRLGFDFCSNLCEPAPALVLDGMHVFDTDLGTLDGLPQQSWDPATSSWYLTGFELPAGSSLTVVGTAPFVVMVDGDVVVAGLLDAAGDDGTNPSGGGIECNSAGQGGEGGPGGFDGGDGAGLGGSGTENGRSGQGPGMFPATGGEASAVSNEVFGAAGGGGGGHLNAGANGLGNAGGVGGTGGEAHDSLPPLVGGGGGGGGSVEKDGVLGAGLDPLDDEGAGGGGGGGVVAIEATGSLTVSGTIDVSGGNGGNDAGCEGATGGGGGGAGGAIQLVSPATDAVEANLVFAGGLGGVSIYGGGAVNLRGGNGASGNVIAM